MKRSQINAAIQSAKIILEQIKFTLPDFGYWTMQEWKENKENINTIMQSMLGWDITDFGSNNFDNIGAVLFTLRNGKLAKQIIGTPYAEKLIILRHETQQQIPMHFHLQKTEDIINRGGGVLGIELYNSTPEGNIDQQNNVRVYMDGIQHTFKAGQTIEITKGNSITLTPGLYHRFWAKKGEGDLVLGEVSSINDDISDNIFLDDAVRFTNIIEDEVALFPLVNEYFIF